jgi:hypothetical protein
MTPPGKERGLSGRQAHALRAGLPTADIPASLAEAERLRQSLLADGGRGDLLKKIIHRFVPMLLCQRIVPGSA